MCSKVISKNTILQLWCINNFFFLILLKFQFCQIKPKIHLILEHKRFVVFFNIFFQNCLVSIKLQFQFAQQYCLWKCSYWHLVFIYYNIVRFSIIESFAQACTIFAFTKNASCVIPESILVNYTRLHVHVASCRLPAQDNSAGVALHGQAAQPSQLLSPQQPHAHPPTASHSAWVHFRLPQAMQSPKV